MRNTRAIAVMPFDWSALGWKALGIAALLVYFVAFWGVLFDSIDRQEAAQEVHYAGQ